MNTGDGIWTEVDELIALRAFASRIFKKADKKSSSPLAGGYISPFRGRGIDFSEVRQYQPGDEIRSMDWRVTARTGKPHTKLFIEERERSVLFVQDFSPSMYFATRNAFKSVVACNITALLAWAAVGHGDRVGAAFFNLEESKQLKPLGGNRGVLKLINFLSTFSKQIPKEYTQNIPVFEQRLRSFRNLIRPGSLVYVISDFQNLTPTSELYLSEMARHADVVAIRVLDPIEKGLPENARLKISNGIQFSELDSSNKETKNNISFQNQIRDQKFHSFCIKHGIHSLSCFTNDDIPEVLRHGLAKRVSVESKGIRNAGSF